MCGIQNRAAVFLLSSERLTDSIEQTDETTTTKPKIGCSVKNIQEDAKKKNGSTTNCIFPTTTKVHHQTKTPITCVKSAVIYRFPNLGLIFLLLLAPRPRYERPQGVLPHPVIEAHAGVFAGLFKHFMNRIQQAQSLLRGSKLNLSFLAS